MYGIYEFKCPKCGSKGKKKFRPVNPIALGFTLKDFRVQEILKSISQKKIF